jgi:ribonuclease HI
MSEDPHALKLYIDGNCYSNPGGAGAVACVAEYPESWNRADEVIFDEGYHETTNNRMELSACIRAFKYVADQGSALNVQRVIVVTDSQYVYGNHRRPPTWRKDKWKTAAGRPIENSDLWKQYLTVCQNVKIRIDLIWRKGTKSPILKMVDRAAKAAGKSPQRVDRGFREGKVARSKVTGGSSSMYPADGQTAIIRIYRSGMIRKTEHKIIFDLFDESSATYIAKHSAYGEGAIADLLHRQHCYRVRFGSDPKYPLIKEILEERPCASLEISGPAPAVPESPENPRP